jgi:hypothetical protein
LKIFGCECWPFLRPYKSSKLSFRSICSVFIGYSKNHLGYKCLHIPSGRVYITIHVVFNENNFPFLTSTPNRISSSPQIPSSIFIHSVHSLTPQASGSCHDTPSITLPNSSTSASSPTIAITSSPTLQPIISFEPSSSFELAPSPEPLSILPARVYGMTTQSQNMIYKSHKFIDGMVKYPPPQALTASIATHEDEPTCFSQASKHPKWRAVMNAEFDALLKNGT